MAERGRAGGSPEGPVQVSIIVPVHNSECWLDECLKSVLEQDFKGTMELSIFNDASKDGSAEIIEKWKIRLEEAGVSVVIGTNDSSQPRGVGFAKNQAVIQSSGTYLCFLDSIIGCQVRREPVDSTERYTRWINNLSQEQLLTQGSIEPSVKIKNPNNWLQQMQFCAWRRHLCICGLLNIGVVRGPWLDWAVRGIWFVLCYLKEILAFDLLGLRRLNSTAFQPGLHQNYCVFTSFSAQRGKVFTSHGPTVIMPTWFCSREWFFHVGRFDEGGKGVPEDLLFFYDHLQKGGGVLRVNHCLLLYRYHPQAATHSVLEETIWNHRVRFLEDRVLSSWTSFTIWNAGKQGKKLYRSLSPANQKKVTAFCDVDEKKIAKGFYTYEESESSAAPETKLATNLSASVPLPFFLQERPKPKIPVCHFRDATPPFVICVKLDLTGGAFETNLGTLNLKEGMDYYHFN
ncbi:UDP-GlcNAc:betaGal beta-1,3-N-acetylglucosaminyltransferase-like 1 [Turdus rufiventris]|nr:UDP-GlcNAc:betaGal beta-1,3-N-acetylglucosaminyltransferase-like 1 [Turdus rufiventris]